MHTGYDNYWMYHNRRHELVLCFPKNDNFSHPVYTNSYKQVQGMGNPSNLYNHIPHPNTVARPHQKVPNDQHRVTSTQSTWPSSVCLQPYSSSPTHNFLPQEVCSVQTNSICDSSQPLQNQVLRNVENNNVSFNPGQTVNCKASAGPINNQDNCNYKAQTARIRVKDISLLNNDKNSNYSSLLGSGLQQVQQKKQHYYLFDSAMTGQSRMYDNGQTQRDCTNLGNTAMSDLNQSYQNYGPLAGHKFHLNHEEQYPQPSTAFYQQNAQFTSERKPCINSVHQKSETSPQDLRRGNYLTLLGKNHNKNGFHETDEQHIQLNSEACSDNNACKSESNALNLSRLTKSNEMNTISQIQPALSETIASTNKPHMEAVAKSSFHNPLTGQEIDTVRITIPSPTQNTINLGDSSFLEPSRNSDLCLPPENSDSTKLSCNCAHDKAQKDVLEISRGNAALSGSGDAYLGVSQLNDQQEPVAGRGAHKENRNLPADNPPGHERSKIREQFGRRETVVVFPGERTLDCSIKPKVENLDAGKVSLESENAVCTEGAVVHTIKSEVDCFTQNRSTEQISDPYFLEGTELSDTKNAENIDVLPLNNPGTKSKTRSTTLNDNYESKIHDVTLEDTGNCTEKPITIEDTVKVQEIAEDEVSVLAGGKCKSEINRYKLDLLIKFLKRDGEPVETEALTENDCPQPLTKPRKERGQRQRRRKLCKTCVVKNKNTEREMISLVSYKSPKNSARRSSTKHSSNESAGIKSSCAENGSTEDSDCLRNNAKTIPKEKQPEKNNNDLSGGKQQAINISLEEKPLKEATDSCSSDGKGITTEERNIINVMRAFQNLKNHFCASCDFTSPVESIWINVVSGELRCLNCFKKMMLKTEENAGSSKKCTADGANTLKALGIHKDEAGDGRRSEEGKNFEKKSKCGGDMPVKDTFKSEDVIEHMKKEVGMLSDYVSGDLRKQNTVNRITEREQHGPIKVQVSDEQVRSEMKIRGEKSAIANSTEEYVSERLSKKGAKQGLDLQDGSSKRSNSVEEVVLCKMQILEEGKEECKKYEAHEESRVLRSMEGCIEQRSCKTDHSKVKEVRVEHEPKRKGDDDSEKPKRKRTTSDEEIDLEESEIVDEYSKRKPRKVRHSSDKLKMRRESKENSEKNKIVVETEMEGEANDWTGKVRKNKNVLKEDSQSQGIYEEESNKAKEPLDLLSRHKKKSTSSQRKRARAETLDPTYVPPNRIAKEGRELSKMRRKYEDFDFQESCLPKNQKKEPKHEQKAEQCSEKMPESSDSERSSGKSPHRKLMDKHNRKSKQCLISRLFKGKHNTKVNPKSKTGGEARKVREHRKAYRQQEEKKETCAEENGYHSQARSKSSHREVESNSEKRKHSGEEPTDGKRHQQRNWENADGKSSPGMEKSSPKDRQDKAVGCIFGAIIEKNGGSLQSKNLDGITYSTTLLARLMKKTKKLSWSLLEET